MRAALLLVVASAVLAAAGSADGGAVFAPGAPAGGRDLILFSSSRDPGSDAGLSAIAPDGSGLRQLPPGLDLRNWAPNGKELALVTPNGAGSDISVMTATGSVRKLVTGAPVGEWAWSPDSSMIAFADSASPPSQPISVLDVASARLIKLPLGSSPLWAPKGRQVAFLKPVTTTVSALWVVNADGSHAHFVATTNFDSEPNWAPDGSRIAFVSSHSLWAVNAGGSNLRELTGWIADIRDMSWSPDGKRVVFETRDGKSSRGGYQTSVFVVNADGSGKRRIARDASVRLAWSPTGDTIALAGDRFAGTWVGLFIIGRDGRPQKLLDLPTLGPPVWSADGRTIAVAAGTPADIWVVDGGGRWRRRVTQGWRYGYDNVHPQWLPRGIPDGLLPGNLVSPAVPSDSVAEGNVLRTTHPIGRLVADGSHVAVTYPKEFGSCVETWDPIGRSVTRLLGGGCAEPSSCCSLGASGFVGMGVAGQTLARLSFWHFAGLDIFDLYVSTADRPASVQVTDVCPDNRYGDCLMPEGDLLGDGDLLVFDSWTESCADPSYPSACAKSPKKDGRLWRLDGTHAVKIASGTGAMTPLSVDAGRILVDHENGTLELLDRNGASLHTYTFDAASVRGARLQGHDLVVTTPAAVEVTDADTGAFLRRWPLPAPDAKLTDLQDGIAVLVAGTDIHLLRLADGTDSVIHPPGTGPVLAQLEPAGLFYSYTADDPAYPGRVIFVPFAQLPLR